MSIFPWINRKIGFGKEKFEPAGSPPNRKRWWKKLLGGVMGGIVNEGEVAALTVRLQILEQKLSANEIELNELEKRLDKIFRWVWVAGAVAAVLAGFGLQLNLDLGQTRAAADAAAAAAETAGPTIKQTLDDAISQIQAAVTTEAENQTRAELKRIADGLTGAVLLRRGEHASPDALSYPDDFAISDGGLLIAVARIEAAPMRGGVATGVRAIINIDNLPCGLDADHTFDGSWLNASAVCVMPLQAGRHSIRASGSADGEINTHSRKLLVRYVVLRTSTSGSQ